MTIVDAIKQKLQLHLRPISSSTADITLRIYAERLLNADLQSTHSFCSSRDSVRLESVERNLRAAAHQVDEMEHATKLHLSSNLALWRAADEPVDELDINAHLAKQKESQFDAFGESRVELEVLLKAVADLRKRTSYRNQASSKPNWRAISIAEECRKLWAENEWISKPHKYGPVPLNAMLDFCNNEEQKEKAKARRQAYKAHLDSFAPTTQQHYRPGPFGRFVEDIFGVLGVESAVGDVVTASTALAALRKMKRQ